MSNNEVGEGKSSSGEFNQNSLIYKIRSVKYNHFIFNKTYMIRKNIDQYFALGKWLFKLSNFDEQETIDEFNKGIIELHNYCSNSGFNVTKQVIESSLNPIIEKLTESLPADVALDESLLYPVGKDIAREIRIATDKFDEILTFESGSKIIYELYSPTQDVNKLIDESETLLLKYDSLTELEKSDRMSGCKSLVYLLPTATVFHLMRVIESITYRYCTKFGIIQIVNEDRREGMGGVLDRLKKGKKDGTLKKSSLKKYNEEIIEELVSIKNLYRNPTSHPTKTYTDDEANRLFNRSKSVIEGLLEKI